MDERIIEHVKREHNLVIGERTAEAIKLEVGSAYPLGRPSTFEVKGRDAVAGIPKTISVDDDEIRRALSGCVASIIEAIRFALEHTPPELSADISDRGIVLTGGGSLLKNLDKRIQTDTNLPVALAENPLTSVVMGTAKMLEDFTLLRRLSVSTLN
jgi:rod shape-determining protein MreB